MRISDWSSDVCSSDLDRAPAPPGDPHRPRGIALQQVEELVSRRVLTNSPGLGIRDSGLERATTTTRATGANGIGTGAVKRSEEHTSELQSLMRISYAVFCLKKKPTSKAQQISAYNSRTRSTSKTIRSLQLHSRWTSTIAT